MRLFGKNPVIERLRSNPQTIRKIHILQGFSQAAYIRRKAKQNGIPVYVMPKSKMEKVGRNVNTQGIIVDIDEYEYMPYEDMLEEALKKHRTLVFLDGLNDPQNFGAIIRSLGCLGYYSIVIPTHKSVKITEAVLRVAAGGENHVRIAQVSNLRKAMRAAKKEGVFIIGTVVKNGQPLEETAFSFPLGIVIGSEQKGIRNATRDEIDLEVSIPMLMDRLSFNAAHAATIICYEAARQRILTKNKNKARSNG